MPNLIQITVTVDSDIEDVLSAVLAMNVPQGWAEETLSTGEIQAVVHTENPMQATEIETTVHAVLPDAVISRNVVKQKDWMVAWREFFTPVVAGSRFLVLAPWMEEERRTTDRMAILIEPKMAFGTGHHETTALCLGVLSDLADAGRVSSGMHFLDLGTGTGILGIGGALLGMTGLGLDIDLQAVENALENCDLNGIVHDGSSPVFAVRRGSIDDAGDGYDLILANILAAPLISMAPAIVNKLRKGGAVVLSGLLTIQADNVTAAYMAEGLPAPRRKESGEWSALIWA